MLQLKALNKEINSTLVFDCYLPIEIEFGSWDITKESTLYWRTGDFKKTLLEIGIAETSGILRSIRLVTPPQITMQDFKIFNNTTELGLPIFEITGWQEDDYYQDESINFQVYFDNNSLVIVFSKPEITLTIINERIRFNFDRDNKLCSIEVINIKEAESKLLLEAFNN